MTVTCDLFTRFVEKFLVDFAFNRLRLETDTVTILERIGNVNFMDTKSVVTERSGSTYELVSLAFPLIISFISHSIIGVADTYVIGIVGTEEQAGVGLGSSIFWVIQSFFIGTFTVINTFVAQYLGAERRSELGRWVSAGICVIPLMLVGIYFINDQIPYLVGLMRTNSQITPHVLTYLTIMMYSTPFFFINFVYMGFFRGVGDMITPMVITVVINVLNVFLNFAFVLGFFGMTPMGVEGVAIASVISMLVSIILYIVRYFSSSVHNLYHTRQKDNLQWMDMLEVLKVGVPVGIAWLLENLAYGIMSIYIATFSPQDLAAHTIVFQVTSFSFMPAVAISVTASTLVGQYLGAQRKDLAHKSASKSIFFAVIFMGTVGLLFFTFRASLIAIFNNDPNVVSLGCIALTIATFFQVFDAMGITVDGVFRGAGYTVFPMVVKFLAMWVIFVPLIFVLGRWMQSGIKGAWTASLIGIVIQGTIMLCAYWWIRWDSKTLVK